MSQGRVSRRCDICHIFAAPLAADRSDCPLYAPLRGRAEGALVRGIRAGVDRRIRAYRGQCGDVTFGTPTAPDPVTYFTSTPLDFAPPAPYDEGNRCEGIASINERVIDMAKIMNAKDIAIDLDTDTRTLRKFFRSTDSPIAPVGKGSRYAVEGKDMRKVRAAFIKWNEGRMIAKGESDIDNP